MLLAAAYKSGKIGRIGTAERVVKAHESPAPFHEGFKSALLRIAQIGGVAFVDDDDVGVLQVRGRGSVQRAINDRAVLGQKLAPVGQELWIVVLPRLMGFESSPEEDMHAVGVLPRRTRRIRRSGLRPHAARHPQTRQSQSETLHAALL